MRQLTLNVRLALVSTASALALLTPPAFAQSAPNTDRSNQSGNFETGAGGVRGGAASSGTTQSADTGGIEEIVVTAQRQAESLQDVPIAVSAFSAEALERQQIDNTSDLQLTLPSITFSKSNFTGANFTIRGIGDAAVAASGDQSVGVHINDMPVTNSRLFETEFFDMERIEVLRGPQGTLFGRNATGGVINLITKRPSDEFEAAASAEYGNYDSIKAQGMVNVPLGDMLGFRLAGTYITRDGYTKNIFDGSRIDGRDQWAIRGTLRFQPTDDTTLDLIGYHYEEDSDRSRIQKQLCHRDPTGILGCLPDRLAFETPNGYGTITGTLTSTQFLRIADPTGGLANFALGDLSRPGTDAFAGIVNPADYRTVNLDYNPTYQAEETILQARLEHDFGSMRLTATGGYTDGSVRSRTDYNLLVSNSLANNPGAVAFRAAFPIAAARTALFQGSNICVSQADRSYVGFIGGNIERCAPNSTDYDESGGTSEQWSVEAHLDSQFDGPLNFLLGGIYYENKVESDYFVASSGTDYAAALLGAGSGGALASPVFNSETNRYHLKSYGVFGEGYWDINDELKLTLGLRYSNDEKFVRDRGFLLNFPVPYGTTSLDPIIQQLTSAGVRNPSTGAFLYDADASRPGAQAYREASVKFDEITGRAVLDWKPTLSFTDDTLVYLSYSRGYKSGGINPPFDPTVFTAPATYRPEIINAFEIGTKNTLLDGTFRANLTAFYYDYKDLQISRIINKTSFNDNTNASVHGIEGEFILNPAPPLVFNINASYLKTKIKDLQLVDPRDPTNGEAGLLLIKDLQNGSNCVVQSNITGLTAAQAVGLTGATLSGAAANPALPLTAAQRQQLGQAGAISSAAASTAVAIPTLNSPGAFSLCSALSGAAAAAASLGQPAPFSVGDGIAADLSGNELPNSPRYKVSVGGQYTWDFANGMSLVARADYAFTGEYYGRSFNKNIDRIESFDIVNAQLQLNGVNDAWFVRAFVQNLTNNDAVTGMYVTDPSTALFTNVFTLEPRRYGIAAGVRF